MTLTTLDMMKWVEDLSVKNGALEEENRNQKLKILELEKKLMSGNVCVHCQEKQINPRRETMKVESESDLIMSEQIPMTIQPLQIDVARENSEISGAVMSMSSEGVDFPIDDIHVKKEAVDDLISDNLQNETPSMDDEIDIKEEDVDYGYAKSKSGGNNSIHDPSLIDSPNADRLSEIPIKHEIERSIQRMFRSPEKVANIELASADFEAEVGTNHDLNHISSSYLTRNLLGPTLDKPQPQLFIQSLYRRKENEPYLKTRTAEKIECETCQMSFDTQFKLMEHIKCHTGVYPLTCFACGENLATKRVLAYHFTKIHPGVKPCPTTLQADHKGFSAKRNLTVEKEKEVKLAGRSKKQGKGESDGEVCNDEEMPIVGEEIDPPCVVEMNQPNLKKPENPCDPDTGDFLRTLEKSGMNGSLMAMSTEGDGTPFGEILVTEEPVNEFIPDNPVTETPAMDEDIDIDDKEVDLYYGHAKSKSVGDDSMHDIDLIDLTPDELSDTPMKLESERSIPEKVSNTELDLQDVDTEVGTTQDLNHASSSHATKELLCPELVKPEAQVSTLSLCGQNEKMPYLMTRSAEKNHCDICSASIDTQSELREHNKSHTGEKTICPNPKTTFKCSVCGKRFSTEMFLAKHMKTHNEGKPSTSLQVDDKGSSVKRSLTVEEEMVKSGGRDKKQRKVESEEKVCNAEEMVGVGGKDPPCVVETNPFKIEKIMVSILSNLGKHDLLNARLISHAWNDESLKVLRKSNFTQVLGHWKIDEYIRFFRRSRSKGSKPLPFIIPFHLKSYISFFSFPYCELNYNPTMLTLHVKSLCKIFGRDCVSTLTLSNGKTVGTKEDIKDVKEIDLVECLTLISPGLKTLDLTYKDFRNDFLKKQIIKFPNLRKLICSESSTGSSGPIQAYISIIENSPNLEDLTFTYSQGGSCHMKSYPLKFNQLKSLSLQSMWTPHNILDKILASTGPPVLRELSLRYDISRNSEDNLVVHNILKSLSSTLKALKFWESLFSRNSGNPRTMRFPHLPHLEHLGLEYNAGYENWIIPAAMNLRQETFPSLKSIELPIGFLFTPSALIQTQECQEDDDRRIEFPNVNKLILRVGAIGGRSVDELNGTLDHLQKIFPTPSKLSLVNARGDDCVKHVLDRIFRSVWSQNIQEIGMIGFRQDCLGQALEIAVGPGSINLTKGNQSGFFKMTKLDKFWDLFSTTTDDSDF